MKFYVVKLLTNTSGQDGSELVAVYDNQEGAKVRYHQILASLHNTAGVLYAVVSILNENGDCVIKEIVDHRPPEPEPEPDQEPEE